MRQLLIEYVLRYRSRFLLGLLFTLLATGFALVTPWLLREAIDTFSRAPTQLGWPLEWYAGAIVLAATGEAISRFAGRYLMTGGSRWAEYDLRNRYFAHLETLEPSFFQDHRTGDLVARATNDLSAVRQLYGPAFQNVANTLVLFVVALVLMFQISAPLASVATLVLPTAAILLLFTRTQIERRFTRVQEQFAAMSDHAQETFAGERVVKAYAQELAEVEAFRATSQEYVHRQLSQIRLSGILWPAMTLVMGLLTVALLFLGGREVVEGRLTLGEFVQFNAYAAMLAWPTMSLGWVATMWQQGSASLRRIHEILETRPSIVDGVSPAPEAGRGAVELRDVSLVLDGRTVLDHVSLTVPAGATYGLVGALGSGKSSLVGLIPRLMDPTSGQVLVDGRDVREWRLDDLRRQIGHVPQETFLFSGSLRENLAFGLTDGQATESRVRDALRLSQLEKDLDQWPAGLDTIVGERGVTLSGGQKQRAAIARAVAKDPRILILDDALSSVDTRTEEAILQGLHDFMAQRTSLVIAHRLSTLRTADRIVVLDGGRIVEEGTHAELVKRGGAYTRIYRRQLIEQELGVEEEPENLGATSPGVPPSLRAAGAGGD